MATQEQCSAAVSDVVERFNSHDAGPKRQRVPRRSVAVTVLDLDVTYKGDLIDGYIVDVRRSTTHRADLRLLCTSDDLLGLVAGEIPFVHAWSSGRIRIDASIVDLIKLRALV